MCHSNGNSGSIRISSQQNCCVGYCNLASIYPVNYMEFVYSVAVAQVLYASECLSVCSVLKGIYFKCLLDASNRQQRISLSLIRLSVSVSVLLEQIHAKPSFTFRPTILANVAAKVYHIASMATIHCHHHQHHTTPSDLYI